MYPNNYKPCLKYTAYLPEGEIMECDDFAHLYRCCRFRIRLEVNSWAFLYCGDRFICRLKADR